MKSQRSEGYLYFQPLRNTPSGDHILHFFPPQDCHVYCTNCRIVFNFKQQGRIHIVAIVLSGAAQEPKQCTLSCLNNSFFTKRVTLGVILSETCLISPNKTIYLDKLQPLHGYNLPTF